MYLMRRALFDAYLTVSLLELSIDTKVLGMVGAYEKQPQVPAAVLIMLY